jgi:putative transposase
MSMPRRQHRGEFNAKVVLEARHGERTINELAAESGVHPGHLTQRKKVALEALPQVLSSRRGTKHKEEEARKAALYQQIGQLKVELDWLKKNWAWSVEQKRDLIDPAHSQLSIRRQCLWLELARSTLYDQPLGESPGNLQLMRWLDEQYTATPFYRVRRMTAWLRDQGYAVNRQRVARLMRLMGLEALYPNPRLSQPAAGHTIYPYLWRGVTVDRVNQVWSADSSYIRLQAGFVSLVAVMAWCSRSVLSRAISITVDLSFCVEALEQALGQGRPEIFTTDQGVQLSSQAFTARLKEGGIRISMDGRGRALDNVLVERLWRSVTYEEVCLRTYQTVWDARSGLARYFAFYNGKRLHQALGDRPPAAVYRG